MNITEKEAELRAEELESGEEYYEILSSGHNVATTDMSSHQ